MTNLFEIVVNIIENLIIISFLTCYFDCKDKGVKEIVGFILGVTIMTLCVTYVNSVYIYEAFLCLLYMVIDFLYCRLFLKGNVYMQIFISGFINCIVSSTAMISQLLISILMNDNIYQIYNMSLERILQIAVSKVLLIVVCIVLLRFRFEYVAKKSNMMFLIIMPIITEISTIGIMQVFLANNELKRELFLISICVMLTNILIYYIFIKISKNAKTEADMIILRQTVENDKKTARNVEELYSKSCAVRHDLFTHFEAILGFLENNPDDAKKYIQTIMQKQIGAVKNMVKTDNICFDAIANAKVALCDKYGIFSQVHVAPQSLDTLSPDEIAILFGNLFDNAIEASQNSAHKAIVLTVQIQDEYLSICMKNTIDSSVLEDNQELHTTKDDKNIHGYGTRNIRNVVKEHDGMICYDEGNGYFISDILIPVKAKSKKNIENF